MGTRGSEDVLEVLLFLWGLGLALVEIKQLHSNGFQASFHPFSSSFPWILGSESRLGAVFRPTFTTFGTSWTLCASG